MHWLESAAVHGPGDVAGLSVAPIIDEYCAFIVDTYALGEDGRRIYDHVFLSRPKGCAKSEVAALIGLFEALGPCRFNGWAKGGEIWTDEFGVVPNYVYAPGEPMGKRLKNPFIRAVATESDQAGLVYDTIYLNLTEGPLAKAMPRKDSAGLTRIAIPGGGEIVPSTSSAASKDGGKDTLVLFDEAISLVTPIPTPSGWTTMGDLKVGDVIFDAAGLPTKVLKATETQIGRDCYRVTFLDGTDIVASSGHLWMTIAEFDPAPKIRTTEEILLDGRQFLIPRAGAPADWEPIASIEPTESVPVRCIAVDNPDHLFQAGIGRHVTHNTHLYNRPELRQTYKTLTRNLVKRRKSAETFAVETTTMFAPGEDSVAESTYEMVKLAKAGKLKKYRQLFDHRFGEIEPSELQDEAKLRKALEDSYGDCKAWNDIDGLMTEIMDPRNDVTSSFRYWFNSPTSAENAWIADYEWARCGPIDGEPETFRHVQPGDTIVMGFDGSRKRRRKGVTDATALIGCRVSDGCLFEVKVWEQPPGVFVDGWEVPTADVDAAVTNAFRTYNVVGFYADPALWETYIAKWEAKFGTHLKVKSTQQHPIEWWMTGNRAFKTVEALRQFQDAVLDGELCHDGSPVLTSHILNARRFATTKGVQVRKESPDSPRKIDAAVAAVLAWQARLDAVAKGIGGKRKRRIAARIR